LEQSEIKPFDPLHLNYEKWAEIDGYVNSVMSREDADRVKSLGKFLSDYTSELSLEILATVDFILAENPGYSVDEVMQYISKWNERKKELFKKEYVQTSFNYLKNYASEISS